MRNHKSQNSIIKIICDRRRKYSLKEFFLKKISSNLVLHSYQFRFCISKKNNLDLCKTSSLRRLIYLHQLTKVRVASHNACYSNESLLHQEQNSWSTMYSTILYRNLQRLSHIVNTWFIRDSHNLRTRICEILLITSFDAYIEVCSLKFEHQDLIIVYSFLIWIVTLFSFNEIEISWDLMFHESTTIDRLVDELKIVIIEYDSLSRTLKSRFANDDEKERKKESLKIVYIFEVTFESRLTWSLQRWRRLSI